MDPLKPESFNHVHTIVNGLQYHYIDQTPSKPSSKPPIVLVHGFPDLWYGWRYQIHPLVEAGHRVIVPSTPGYCDSEAPRPLEYYTFKRIATDLVTLLSNLGISKAIYIGHDWGSIIVQRVALWFPEHVFALGVVCVPLIQPSATFIPLELMVKAFPNFAYQLYFATDQSEKDLSGLDAIEKFLKAIFRIKGDRSVKWNTGKDMLAKMGNPSMGKLWEKKAVWEYYLHTFQKAGSLRGPLNYYKTRELNYKDELELVDKAQIKCPVMFIGALGDVALPPTTWIGQDWVPQLEKHTVSRGHWTLVEGEGKEIIPILQTWVAKVSKTSKL